MAGMIMLCRIGGVGRKCNSPRKCSGFNTLVTLVVWCLWKHRNAVIFDGQRPAVPRVLRCIREEAEAWCLAGAQGLQRLLPDQGQ